MKTAHRLQLLAAFDDFLDVEKAVDPFAPDQEELQLRGAMYDAWTAQLAKAWEEIRHHHNRHAFDKPDPNEIPQLLEILTAHLSGDVLTKHVAIDAKAALKSAWALAGEEVKVEAGKQGVRKDGELVGASFGVLFGQTEQHAIEAMYQQAIVAAGGMWDATLSESIKKKLEEWFNSDPANADPNLRTGLTRDDLINQLEELVTSKLPVDAEHSYPRIYFEHLATHTIVRARNVGKTYNAKNYGATGYRLTNPIDSHTSEICRGLVKLGKVYPIAGAEAVIAEILSARTMEELKQKQPFWTSSTEDRPPVPPLHWAGCRTGMEFEFA